MEKYQHVYTSLGLPATALRLAQGLLPTFVYMETPFEPYGFPPALIPLWSEGSLPASDGFWKHWFVDRDIVLARIYLDAGQVIEIARSFDQLSRIIILNRLAIDLANELGPLPQELGIADAELAKLYEVASVSGDDMEAFKHSSYAQSSPLWQELPLECFPDGVGYTGDFPHESMELTPEVVRRICTLEVSEALKERIAALPWAPPWFTTTDQASVFAERLEQHDYAGAWMSLNSSKWDVTEGGNAIRRLAAAVNNEQFSLLADAWASQPHFGVTY